MEKVRKIGSLGSKLTRNMALVVSTAFCLIFAIVIFTSYKYYRNQEISSQRNQLEKTAEQIRGLQNTVGNIAKQLIYDDVVQKGISTQADSSGNYLYLKRSVEDNLKAYAHIIDSIQEIMIYTTDGRTFSNRYVKDPFKPENHSWYLNFFETGKTSGYTEVHKSEPNQDGHTEEVISYILSYYSVENPGQELGKLVINVRFDEVRKMATLNSDLLEGYCLYDGTGTSIVENGMLSKSFEEIKSKLDRSEIHESVKVEEQDVYIISGSMMDDWILISEISGDRLIRKSFFAHWQLLLFFILILLILMAGLRIGIRKVVTPINQLSEAAREVGHGNFEMHWQLLLFFILILLILMAGLRIGIRKVVTPINQLSEAAREVGHGNFEMQVQIQTNDELEILANVFNKMVVDIQNLMNESVEHEKVLRRMQIENLLLQINPHFIYNTINSIVYMARMGGNDRIADFANAFIKLLQNTLNVRDSVYQTVGMELQTVENYLYLQKYRYGNKFTYEIQCEEELKDCQILNVMVQPAVENAIFHGIAPKEGTGKLSVSVCRDKNVLVVCVEDNGVGMSPETLAEQMKPDHVQRGGVRKIGVANVRNRIREIYGEPYNLQIESKLNMGTKVIMTVPYVKATEKND